MSGDPGWRRGVMMTGTVGRSRLTGTIGRRLAVLGALSALVVTGSTPALAAAQPSALAQASPVQDVSRACGGQNAEVETATGAPAYVYDLWIGCFGIGFARSVNG